MRFPRFEPGTHGFKVHQDNHYAMEANTSTRQILPYQATLTGRAI